MLVTALQGGMQAAKVKATDAQKSERILPAAFLLVATQGPAQGFQPQPSAQRLHLGGHGGQSPLVPEAGGQAIQSLLHLFNQGLDGKVAQHPARAPSPC